MSTDRLRIAVNGFSTPVGGGRTHLRRVLPRLAALAPQHAFTVFGSAGDDEMRATVDLPNVAWSEIAAGRGRTRAKLLVENVAFPVALARGRFDVVLCPANVSHFLGGTRRVIVVHNSLPFYRELYPYESARTRVRLRLLAWATHHFIRRAEGSVFVSARAREDALRGTSIVPRDEAIVYHGVDEGFGGEPRAQALETTKLRYGLPGDYVLYASHLYRYKRFESLIEAWGRIPAAVRAGRTLVIAGEPHDRGYAAQLATRVRALPEPLTVRFIGGVATEALSRLHAGADAVVFLSTCESGSIAVLEALSSGRPLLLSNRSAMPELGGEAALYADPDRPEEVAAQLTRLLTDRALAEELGARAKRRAAEFTWDRTARGILALIERVGAGASPRR